MRDFRHSLPMELLRAREAAMARFRPLLREYGLTEQQWRVLRALSEYDGIDASVLAQKSFLLAPSLTRILRHLEDQSLIRRHPNKKDNRKAVVELSAKGRRLFDKVGPRSEILYADIESEFGADRLEELYTLLADFCATINNE